MIRKKTRQVIIVAAVAALAGFGLAALFWSLSRTPPARPQRAADTQQQQTAGAAEQPEAVLRESPPAGAGQGGAGQARAGEGAQQQPSAAAAARPQGSPTPADTGNFFQDILAADQPASAPTQQEGWRVTIPRIILRLALAAALAAMLAFRPRKDSNVLQRNLYVAQTQILLAVVASSLMMVVGDNAARAFGIFAAVSLVRFRTNIRDPKEITVLLISLSLGLATGVGRWELAIILALFVLPLLWFLEYNEEEQVYRAMELTVKTRDTEATQEVLQGIFRSHGMNAEVRQIDPPDEKEPVGCIMYHVQMSLTVSTDEVSEEIMATDGQHVEAIEWEQQKNTAYIYQ